MDSTTYFSGLADVYTRGRPAYANSFIESLYSQHGFSAQSVIADIGSGTGKFAKQLLDKGSCVYGVEPNEDMRNTAIQELSKYEKFHAVNGNAAETTLENASVDFVTAAQAFHWFDTAQFQKEARRILKEDGLVFLVWNMRDMSCDVNRNCFEIFAKYCPRFRGFNGGIQKDDFRIRQFFNEDYTYAEFENPLSYKSKDLFISRCLSSSYSLKKGDTRYQEYLDALSELFDQHTKKDILTCANKTVAYFGKVK